MLWFFFGLFLGWLIFKIAKSQGEEKVEGSIKIETPQISHDDDFWKSREEIIKNRLREDLRKEVLLEERITSFPTDSNAGKIIVKFSDISEMEAMGFSKQADFNQLFDEKFLETILEKNLEAVEVGLTLVKDGRQYSTNVGKVDLLTKDKNDKYVVIEIKNTPSLDQPIGQIMRYMDWVKQNLSRGEEVRGIIIVPKLKLGVDKQSKMPFDKSKFVKMGLQSSVGNINIKEFTTDIKGDFTITLS